MLVPAAGQGLSFLGCWQSEVGGRVGGMEYMFSGGFKWEAERKVSEFRMTEA